MGYKVGRSHRWDDETRRQFFLLVDGGMSVRAAARSLGIGPDLGYLWRRQAGLSAKRAPSRVYTEQDKAEFFRRLELNRNVTAVARELGFVRVTCFKWVHQAGIYISRDAQQRKQAFLQLRAQGVARSAAASQLGVSARQASDWDRGVRQIPGGRIYPDGRVVHYNRRAGDAMAGTTSAYLHPQVRLADLERPIHPRYLDLGERELIHDLRARGVSVRGIARQLRRSASTVSRELERNSTAGAGYLPYTAQRLAVSRRPRPKDRKLLREGPLRDYTAARLARKWSPEQISHRLMKDFPGDDTMRVATETFYQAIYIHAQGALKREVRSTLRRGGISRQPRRSPAQRIPRFASPAAAIGQRDPQVQLRAVPGHWEGDLIIGAGQRSAIATLVERTTRFTLLAHLPGGRDAATVRHSLCDSVRHLPQCLRRTLTWDQGGEMAEHTAFTAATDMAVYFCEPASPWQRGSNENTNGLLRQYFPKGTDLSKHSPEHLRDVALELNERPRKVLGWDSPAERLHALLAQNQ